MDDLLLRIGKIVGETGLLTGDEAAARTIGWMPATPCRAKAIVRPASAAEISDVLGLCHGAKQPVICAGGQTGLVSSLDAEPHEIILSLERMRNIEEVDPVGRTITVEAGAPLQSVQEAAQRHGLHYAVDLGARGTATIGGNIATNAGGNQVVRFGMTREQVLGLEAVLPDGTILSSMNKLLKNNTGYDLKQLFIGAEGTLGIVTRAVLRLHPAAISENTALVAAPTFDAVAAFFRFAGANLGGALSSFEVMWPEFYHLLTEETGRHSPPLKPQDRYYIIIEAHGIDEDRDSAVFSEVLENALEKEIIEDAAIAGSKAQASAIWAIRDDIEGLFGALMPGATFDVSLPIVEMESYVSEVTADVKKTWGNAARITVFGHIGDGNLHIIVTPGSWTDETKAEIEKLVYAPLQAIGGSVSAEHGIGLEKRDFLALSRSQTEIAMMRKLKGLFDPHNILNPRRIFSDH